MAESSARQFTVQIQRTKLSQPPQTVKFYVEPAEEEACESMPFYGFDADNSILPEDQNNVTEPRQHETDVAKMTAYLLQSTPNKENIVRENPLASHTTEVNTTTSPKKRKTRSAAASFKSNPAAKIKTTLCAPEDDSQNEPNQDAVSFLIENMDACPSLIYQDETSKAHAYEKRKNKCQVCGKRFYGKSNLVDHLRFHANVKPFKCDHCGKAFTQSGSLRCHLRTHTDEKPFVCQICNKAFNQSSSLKVHIRSHTQERNHVCEVCSKRFLSNSDLSKHRYTHAAVKRYQCEFCNSGFAQNSNLRKHMQSKHSDRLDGSNKKKTKIEADLSAKIQARKVIDVMPVATKLFNEGTETKPENGRIKLLNNDRKQGKKSGTGGTLRIVNPNFNDIMAPHSGQSKRN